VFQPFMDRQANWDFPLAAAELDGERAGSALLQRWILFKE